MQVFGYYDGEQITVKYTAFKGTQREDYGVEGSPSWDVIIESTVEVHAVEMLGIEYNLADLPEAMQKSIMDLYSEADWGYQ